MFHHDEHRAPRRRHPGHPGLRRDRLSVGPRGLRPRPAAGPERSVSGAKHPDKPADPIIVHPDVRRMLLTMRAWTEGARALAAWVAIELDKSAKHPDPAEREASDDFVSLLTPVVKAMFTDNGFAAANIGMQVMGGHGYIREWGMEQLVRDCRITQIYEGTNGIQALDLVGRKLPSHMGRLLRRFFHPVDAYDPRAAAEKPGARRVRAAARQGLRPPAAGLGAHRAKRPRRPRGSRRRRDRLPAPLRADRATPTCDHAHGRAALGETSRPRTPPSTRASSPPPASSWRGSCRGDHRPLRPGHRAAGAKPLMALAEAEGLLCAAIA